MEKKIVQGYGKCPKLPWMIEFHSTADGKIFNQQLKAAFAENHLEHLSNLHEKSKLGKKRLTQLLGVIPRNPNDEDIEDLLKAGMTLALLRMTDFTPTDAKNTIEVIRKVNEEFGKKIGRIYPLSVGLDISEPEILTGKLRKSARGDELQKGDHTKITVNKEFENKSSKQFIYVNYEKIPEVIKPGDSLILESGQIQINLSAFQIARDIVECIVETAGKLVDNLSVKLPNTPVNIISSELQEEFLKIAAEAAVDTIFVTPTILETAKEIVGATVQIVLKIENASAVDDLDRLIAEIDAIYIDCDKLMISAKENVFLLQKSLVAKCNKLGKPVIVGLNCNNLTKPVVFDVANSVIDGIDALLLPPDPQVFESVSLLCKSAEMAIYQRDLFDSLVNLKKPPIEPIQAVAISAVEASFTSNAAAIILITTSGRCAKLIAAYKPRCPIIALTRFGRIAKQLMIYKGVIPIFYVKTEEAPTDLERNMQIGMTFGKLNGYIRMGDAVVIVFGTRHGVGFKNCMEVVFASEYDTIPEKAENL